MIDRAARAAVHARPATDSRRAPVRWSRAGAASACTSAGGRRGGATGHACTLPASTRRLLRGSVGLGEAYARRPVGRRRPDRPRSDRRARDRPLRPSPRAARPGAPAPPAASGPARAQHAPGRSAQHRRPLRPRQRRCSSCSSTASAMMYSSALLRDARRDSLEQAQHAKLARICERARAAAGRAPARDRHRLGRPGALHGLALRLPRDDDHASRANSANTPRHGSGARGPRGPRSRARRRLPRADRAATTGSSRSR